MAILYTQSEVNNALLRAQVALYLISDNIESGYVYFYPGLYANYKALQYDIYTLFDTLSYNNQFISYSSTPTVFEYQFYEVVGSMINKIKQVDVFGAFNGSANPNYQPPSGIAIVVPGYTPNPPITKSQANLADLGGGNWYLPITLPGNAVPALVTSNGQSFAFTFDDTVIPNRIFGFTGNYTQTIIVYLNQ